MQRKNKKGFSIVEISIIILLISIVSVGLLINFKSNNQATKSTTTNQKIDKIYKALTSFVANNRRLPCPALLDLAKNDGSYGFEASNPGYCNDTFVSSNAPNLVYGTIPFNTLQISSDFIEDEYGSKFSYVVDKRFTITNFGTNDANGFEVTRAMPSPDVPSEVINIININSGSTSIMSNALFVIISHGNNKYNAFSTKATTQNTTSSVTRENENSCNGSSSNCSKTSAARFDNIFFIPSSELIDQNFDDKLFFKNKLQILQDSGLEFVMCSASEAAPPSAGNCSSNTWSTNAKYNDISISDLSVNCCARKCDKYGIWQSPYLTTCPESCSLVNNAIYGSGTLKYTGVSTSVLIGTQVDFVCNFKSPGPSAVCYVNNIGSGLSPKATCQTNNIFGSIVNPCSSYCYAVQSMDLGTNSQVVSGVSNGACYAHGGTIQVGCKSGQYYISGSNMATCQTTGNWSTNYVCGCLSCDFSSGALSTTVRKCCHTTAHDCTDAPQSQYKYANNYNQGNTAYFDGDGGGCSGGYHKARTSRTLTTKTCSCAGSPSVTWSSESGFTDY